MTAKADFTEEEWQQVLEAPPSAGLVVIASDRGGSIRETFSMAKAYAEAHKKPGERASRRDRLGEAGGGQDALEVARGGEAARAPEHPRRRRAPEAEGQPEEVEAYRQFILDLANRVAEARKEGFMGLSGERVSEDERSAIDEITARLS